LNTALWERDRATELQGAEPLLIPGMQEVWHVRNGCSLELCCAGVTYCMQHITSSKGERLAQPQAYLAMEPTCTTKVQPCPQCLNHSFMYLAPLWKGTRALVLLLWPRRSALSEGAMVFSSLSITKWKGQQYHSLSFRQMGEISALSRCVLFLASISLGVHFTHAIFLTQMLSMVFNE
jgi:hypothetical protein